MTEKLRTQPGRRIETVFWLRAWLAARRTREGLSNPACWQKSRPSNLRRNPIIFPLRHHRSQNSLKENLELDLLAGYRNKDLRRRFGLPQMLGKGHRLFFFPMNHADPLDITTNLVQIGQ